MSRRFWHNMNKQEELRRSAATNYWFESGGLASLMPSPMLERHILADIVIIGGGFTGLAAAYNLIIDHPDKKIVLLEASCCGYGASGRSGGFADAGIRGMYEICEKRGPEEARKIFDITLQGIDAIRNLVDQHGVDCDFSPTGSIELATQESQLEVIEEEKAFYDALGLEATIIGRADLQKMVKSTRYVGALRYPYGATVNPFKLARGMKRVIEEKGVEVYEKTPVLRLGDGGQVTAETEKGQVRAPTAVLATNAYSPALGFFKHRLVPMCAYLIATEPLTGKQREAIGWAGREKLSDLKPVFDYFHLTSDNRIVFGGAGLRYLLGGRICGGVHRPSIRALKESLLQSFPQLEGIRITHQWGGTLGMSFDFLPSVGALGENRNVLYAVGYSGEGTVLSQLAGKIINDLYSGKNSALAGLFFVGKIPPYTWPDPVRYFGVLGLKFYYTHFGRRSAR